MEGEHAVVAIGYDNRLRQKAGNPEQVRRQADSRGPAHRELLGKGLGRVQLRLADLRVHEKGFGRGLLVRPQKRRAGNRKEKAGC